MFHKICLLVFLLSGHISSFNQEEQKVLKAPENWISELIPFPIGFAPSLDFVGVEDLRFSPEWSDSTGQQFWTYCFAWYIEKNVDLSESKLSEYFNSYYDGLMGINEMSELKSERRTQSTFIKTAKGFNPHYALENLLRLKTASKSDAMLHFLISA